MRYIFLLVLLLCGTVAWCVDGEYRCFYTGNLAALPLPQQTTLTQQLGEWLRLSQQEGVPAFFISAGNIISAEPGHPGRDAQALSLLANLTPAALALGPNETQHNIMLLRAPSGQPLPWLSLTKAPTGVQLPDIRYIQLGKLRLGFIGLTLPSAQLPDKALRHRLLTLVVESRRHCDLLLLLGVFDDSQASMLTMLLPKVDMVLGNCDINEPQTVGADIMLPIQRDQPYAGVVEFAIRDGKLAAWRGGLLPVELGK